MREGVLYFNNNSSEDFKLYITSYPVIPFLNELYEKVDIDGGNGSLYIDLGKYEDREITFNFDYRNTDINDFDMIDDWFRNIEDNRLVFGREDRCYRVKKVVLGDWKKEFRELGNFDVTFIVNPFLEDTQETTVSTTSKLFEINYMGTVEGESLIKITGSGNIQISCNDEIMEIDNVDKYVEIDSRLKQTRNSDGTSKDWDTIGDFIKLENGINRFEIVGNVNNIEVIYSNMYL